MMRALRIALAMLMPCAAWAADFYGIELGKPMSYPECETRQIGKDTFYAASGPESGACFKRPSGAGTAIPDGSTVMVLWPLGQGPQHARGDLDAFIQGGQVVRVRMTTNGADSQGELFADFVRKFGKPLRKDTQPLRNMFGQRYTAIYAGWVTRDVVVIFEGIAYRADSGQVNVYTRAAWDAEQAKGRMNESKRPRP
jgi:hypothetical protein